MIITAVLNRVIDLHTSGIRRDRRAKLVACIAKKNNDKWEKKYAEFDDYAIGKRASCLDLMVKSRRRLQRTKGVPYGEIGERDWRVASRGRRHQKVYALLKYKKPKLIGSFSSKLFKHG